MNKEKFINELERMVDSNYEIIENGDDSDNACKRENSTLENLIYLAKIGMFDIK